MGWKITFDGTWRTVTDGDRQAEIEAATVANENPPSMWEGGKVVDLDDLSAEEYDVAAVVAPRTVTWYDIWKNPCYITGPMYEVIKAAARKAGVNPPGPPKGPRDAITLTNMFEETLDPSVGLSDSTTDSSTGPSPDSGGPTVLPDGNASPTL